MNNRKTTQKRLGRNSQRGRRGIKVETVSKSRMLPAESNTEKRSTKTGRYRSLGFNHSEVLGAFGMGNFVCMVGRERGY